MEQSLEQMKDSVLAAADRQILFLPHAVKQMSRLDRMITAEDIKVAVFHGEVIEEYADDPRGASCLMLHTGTTRALHVVCAPKQDYLAIITAYIPAPEQWSSDFRRRI